VIVPPRRVLSRSGLSARSYLSCTHLIGRLELSALQCETRSLHSRTASPRNVRACRGSQAVPPTGLESQRTQGRNWGLRHRLETPIQNREKAQRYTIQNAFGWAWMGSDRPFIPIQKPIHSHPNRVWMGSRGAVTMVGAEEVVDGGCFASGKTLRNREHQRIPELLIFSTFINSLDFSLGCFPTPTRRKRCPFF